MSLKAYQNKIRIRVCGLLIEDDQILLVKLLSPLSNELIWIPPGGGVDFGERREEALQREFLEETGLHIETGEHLFTNEVIHPPYHAIEFYYKVKRSGGKLSLGSDPEHDEQTQIIRDLRFISITELSSFNVKPEQLFDFL